MTDVTESQVSELFDTVPSSMLVGRRVGLSTILSEALVQLERVVHEPGCYLKAKPSLIL